MMRRLRLAGAAAVAALLVGAVPAQAQSSDDETTPQLGGYVAGAAGWAVSFQPVIPALLPTGDAPFEATLSLSTASIRSGGNAFGRAAMVWPGSAAANLGPLLGVAGQPFLGGLIPPWPAAVEATAQDGEKLKQVSPAITMRAFGSETRAEGESDTPDVDFPGLLTIQAVSSKSAAEVTDVDVTSSCIVRLEGVSLLDGGITFDTINSRSLARSTGDKSSADGVVQVVGLKVNGISAELTGDGLHATGFPPDADPVPGIGAAFPGSNPDDALNQALSALGASIRLTRATNTVAGGSADRLANGVLVSINDPAFPDSHFDITLASTGSAALASLPVDLNVSGTELSAPGGELGGALDSSGAPASTSASPTFSSSDVGNLALGSPSGSASPSSVSPSAQPVAGSLAGYHFKGVPWQMIVLVLLISVFLARWLRGFLQTRLLS